MTITIRSEAPTDEPQVWNVNRQAFGCDVEANLVNALRAGGHATISLVAQLQDEVVGHLLLSALRIVGDSPAVAALALAPLAVLPGRQRQGIGSQLVVAGIAEARHRGHRILTVLGHPSYYPRFGFSAELAKPLVSPFGGGEAWMALELVPASLAGVSGRVEYAPPFMSLL
jgi:putative acetyltransferase